MESRCSRRADVVELGALRCRAGGVVLAEEDRGPAGLEGLAGAVEASASPPPPAGVPPPPRRSGTARDRADARGRPTGPAALRDDRGRDRGCLGGSSRNAEGGGSRRPLRVPVPTRYGCVACGAARYGNVLGKATSFEPTQSVVTKPSVISPSSASITSSAGLRPFRKPAELATSTVRMSGSRTAARPLILPGHPTDHRCRRERPRRR